jgi:hypothetical protein
MIKRCYLIYLLVLSLGVTAQENLVPNGHFDENTSQYSGGSNPVDYYTADQECTGVAVIPSPKWANGPNKIFYKCPQVKIGVGTDNPLHKLDVRGGGYFSGSIGIGAFPSTGIQVNSVTNQDVGFCINHNSPNPDGYGYKAIVNDEETRGFGMFSNVYNKDVFAVYSNGKMTISNASQTILQLETDGLLRARRVKVDTEVWPDYVFSSNYDLMPLLELDLYIKREKHLPNIPDEGVILKEGIDLAEMNVLLLEKIEEVTLYTIGLKKEIEQMRSEIESLKSER